MNNKEILNERIDMHRDEFFEMADIAEELIKMGGNIEDLLGDLEDELRARGLK